MDYRSGLLDQLDPTKKKQADEDPFAPPPSPITGAGGTATNTGIGGGLDLGALSGTGGVAGTPGPGPVAPPTSSRDFSRLTGYDEGKFNANKDDAKYQMGGVLSGFDPSKGFDDPAVADALDQLGYGDFSGRGDKLSLKGLTDKGRAAGLAGDYTDADFNQGFKTGKGKWAYADPVEEARLAAAAGPGQGGGMFAGSSISPILQGDAQGDIQNALGKLSAPSDLLQQLLAQLQGGA